MSHHASYGLAPEFLDVVLIDDSKPMQAILRSILGVIRPQRMRIFDRADEALEAMLHEPPNVIVTDWRMDPMSGNTFLKTIRDRRMSPLCFVPVIVVTAHATRQVVERAMEAGAHHVLVKPLSPSVLLDRITALAGDSRPFILNTAGDAYEIEGVHKVLARQNARTSALMKARQFHDVAVKRAQTIELPLAEPINPGPAGAEPPARMPARPPFHFAAPRRARV